MRKPKVCFAVTLLIIAFILGVYYINLPEYQIYWSFSRDGADFREAELYVIIYKPRHVEKIVEKAVKQDNIINGTPNKLTVRCFLSKRDLERGEEYYKVVYEYDDSQVTKPPGVWEGL